jgi:acyl-coenzyme A thioesterase PaaI-like protein
MDSNQPKTHKLINKKLCGIPVAIFEKGSEVSLEVHSDMAVDETGLVHGGFIFGLADYAAMVAVNHPNVVLGSASVRFSKPVKVGDQLTAKAEINSGKDPKIPVKVNVWRANEIVFQGEFICFILERHVLGD